MSVAIDEQDRQALLDRVFLMWRAVPQESRYFSQWVMDEAMWQSVIAAFAPSFSPHGPVADSVKQQLFGVPVVIESGAALSVRLPPT